MVHATAKKLLKVLFQHCGIFFDDTEPSKYEIRVCPKCHTMINVSEGEKSLASHAQACSKGVTTDELDTVNRQRPDIRFMYFDVRDNTWHIGVIDVSRTSGQMTDPRAFDHRVENKYKLYKDLAHANGEEFYAMEAEMQAETTPRWPTLSVGTTTPCRRGTLLVPSPPSVAQRAPSPS